MKANRLLEGRTCSLCHSPLEMGQDVRNCEACLLSYHLECWQLNGGCGTYGCVKSPGGKGLVPDSNTLRVKLPPVSSEAKTSGLGQGTNEARPSTFPFQPAYGAVPATSGMAVAGFILGLTGFLTWWVPLLGILLSILGLVFSAIAISAIQRSGGHLYGKGLAIAGFVLSVLVVVLFFLSLVGFGLLLGSVFEFLCLVFE
ncbi:DUF4190 domain-containing protein [bacterium]|nr:DUF4190 domain-containing protein [bacterium]